MTKTSVLITGASTGIGAVYAERFASRGHDLILVARDKTKLDALAERLRQEKGVSVDVLPADLTQAAELATVETRLREDEKIGVLINNAGIAQSGHFIGQTSEAIERLIALNVTALTRLASAAAPRFVNAGEGAIVNISRFTVQPKPSCFSCRRDCILSCPPQAFTSRRYFRPALTPKSGNVPVLISVRRPR